MVCRFPQYTLYFPPPCVSSYYPLWKEYSSCTLEYPPAAHLWTPDFVGISLRNLSWAPPLSQAVMVAFTPCVGCLSRLSMGIRTDRCIFSSVTRLQTSGGKGPGFTHLPVLQAQRRVLARLPLRTAAAAVIHTLCARLPLLSEPANGLSDRC